MAAYTLAFGQSPSRETAELLLALVELENAHGRAIIQFNWGNVSTVASDAVDYWVPPWFDLDAINAMPDTEAEKKARYLKLHAQMVAGKVPSAFLALPSHVDGARLFLQNVKPSMYDAARTGDPLAFAHAYWASGYCPDQACKDSGPVFQQLQAAIRSAGYFSALTPDPKKKVSAAEAAALLPPLPRPGSPSPSFGQLSAPGQAGGADVARELVVFAASCELADVEMLAKQGNTAGIAERIAHYWADVLHQAETAPHPKEWCGAFALWALHAAKLGLELRWRFATATDPRSGFLYALTRTHDPKPGDIAYLDKPWQHHAIVYSVEGDTVHTIDGNQGPARPIQTHEAPLSHWTAYYSIESLLPKERV